MSTAESIENHIIMLMDEPELERIGADKTRLRSLSQRIMRILAAYNDLQAANAKLKNTIEQISRIACGEDQVADDDSEGMGVIYDITIKTLQGEKAPAASERN